jgi:tetratricopeptide (TPR) repeat protein
VKLLGGRIDDSIADFDRASSLNPRQPEAYLNKGSALLKKREAAAAISLFDEALQRGTSRPELAYYSRAVAHEDNGNLEAAYQDYSKARAAAPKWALPAQELSRFQVRRASGTSL